MAVLLQHRSGHVAQEMVLAVTVWDGGKLGGNVLHKGRLLVRHPQHHADPQRRGQFASRHKQLLHLGGGARQQRLREPHPFVSQLADDVQRLVALLRLQTVNAQLHFLDAAILGTQRIQITFPSREHGLIAITVLLDIQTNRSQPTAQ